MKLVFVMLWLADRDDGQIGHCSKILGFVNNQDGYKL